MSAVGVDQSTLLIKTKVGMEYTDQTNEKRYFNAPPKFLGKNGFTFFVLRWECDPSSELMAWKKVNT